MANLRDAVAAILADVTRAQNQANLLSRNLSETYRDDHLLRVFPVPNAQLAGLTLDLRFAVVPSDRPAADGGAGTARGPRARPPASAFHALAFRLAETVLEATADVIPTTTPRDTRLAFQAELRSRRAATALASHLAPVIQRWHERLTLDDCEKPVSTLAAEALKEVGAVLRDHLVRDPALQEAFGGIPATVEAVRKECGTPLRKALERFLNHTRTVEVGLAAIPDFDVILDTEALARLPQHALQTLRLRIGLDEYRWMVAENGRSQELVRATHGRDPRPEPQ